MEIKGNGIMIRLSKMVAKLEKTAQESVSADNFDKSVEEFQKYCQDLVDRNRKENFPNISRTEIKKSDGKRYVKFIADDGTSRSSWAFIDKSNGDVLKPASWNAPAKHARGNIFDKNTWKSVSAYGPAYMKRF